MDFELLCPDDSDKNLTKKKREKKGEKNPHPISPIFNNIMAYKGKDS